MPINRVVINSSPLIALFKSQQTLLHFILELAFHSGWVSASLVPTLGGLVCHNQGSNR